MNFDPVSTNDNCGVASIENDFNNLSTLEGVSLPLGITNITWTVTDNSGNTADCSFNVTVSSTVGTESFEENEILIYPNPTGGINLEFASAKIRHMKITDLSGRTILITALKYKTEIIDLSHLERGIYIISILDDDKTLTRRIAKQ